MTFSHLTLEDREIKVKSKNGEPARRLFGKLTI